MKVNFTKSETDWCLIPQERITNALSKPNQYLPLIFGKEDVFSIDWNNLTISADNKSVLLGLTPATFQVLDFILLEARAAGFSSVSVSTADYMKARGLKDRKTARKQLEKGIEDLFRVELRYNLQSLSKKELKRLPKAFPLARFHILDPIAFTGQHDITVSFSKHFAPYIAKAAPMAYHRILLRINTHDNPNAFPFGRKILEARHMAMRKTTCNVRGVRLSVETLLAVSAFPNADRLKELNRNAVARVIRPFERDLNALGEMGRWEYCLARGEALKDGDVPSNWETFKRLYVRFTLDNPPAVQASKGTEVRG